MTAESNGGHKPGSADNHSAQPTQPNSGRKGTSLDYWVNLHQKRHGRDIDKPKSTPTTGASS